MDLIRSLPDQWSGLKKDLSQDKILYSYVLTTTFLAYLVSDYYSSQSKLSYDALTYLSALVRMCYISFIVWSAYCFSWMLYRREPRPTITYFKAMLGLFNPISKAISFMLLILALNLTFSCYSYFKSLIPDLNPFRFDQLFYEIDLLLHFGISPWELTHSIFSSPFATLFINFLYNFWFFLIWGFVLFFIARRDLGPLRDHFLITFMSAWLLIGGVCATFLSSAGPCYIHLLDPSATQYLYLIDTLSIQNQQITASGWPNLWSLNAQDSLWLRYIERDNGIGVGISAMPSMHVSISVLMALSSYQLHKTLGVVMWIYAAFIQIGSVHLAWHYAIDGYVSIILTIVLWKLVGMVISKYIHRL